MDGMLQDLRHAARALAKAPGFTALAALALALGIGANAALFSVVDGVLLAPLPYREPGRLLALSGHAPGLGLDEIGLTPGELVELSASPSFEGVAAWSTGRITVGGGDEPERLDGASITAGLLESLGVRPALGRAFRPEEEREGGEQVAILSDALWRRRFGADPGVLGRRVELDGKPATIIGVMPPAFALPSELERGVPALLFVPLPIDRESPSWVGHNLGAFARLAPGVTVAAARAEVAATGERIEREQAQFYPSEIDFELRAATLHDAVVGDVRPALVALLAGVGLVLAIACANVANLLLARAEARQKEIAVRAALGCGGLRLARLFVLESLLVAALGAGGGVVLARGGLAALRAFGPASLPRLGAVAIDLRVLAFTLAVTLVSALALGLAPAVHSARADLGRVLKEEGRSASAGRRGRALRRGLVVAEVALAVVLVVSAGLLVRTFERLMAVDTGFEPTGVLTMRTALPAAAYPDGPRSAAFFAAAVERIEALPGVLSAAVANDVPLEPGGSDSVFALEGQPNPFQDPEAFPNGFQNANFRVVSPGYFATIGLPVLEGRSFGAGDDAAAPGAIVVNRELARRFFPGRSPLGQRMHVYRDETTAGPWLTVVGVVGDSKTRTLTEEPKPEMYLPASQAHLTFGDDAARYMAFLVRTDGDPARAAVPVQQAVRELAAVGLPLYEVHTLADVVGAGVARPRLSAFLAAAFAGLALALAAVGVYGVVSYSVARRIHEMGVRLALGAKARQLVRLVVGQGMALVAAGLGLGFAAALGVTRLLAGLLWGVGPFDVATYGGVALLLASVALIACLVPALRAARVDPVEALRRN